jgi:hypothetical protein
VDNNSIHSGPYFVPISTETLAGSTIHNSDIKFGVLLKIPDDISNCFASQIQNSVIYSHTHLSTALHVLSIM